MSSPIAVRYEGDGAFSAPGAYWARKADADFVIGETYRLVEYQDRSTATHNHQFAWLHEAWQSLPERLAELYPTPEHLRKRALIQAGYYDETAIDAGTTAAALRVAAYLRAADDFTHVIVKGAYVLVRKAKSQSRRAMDKAAFQASKNAIMDIIAAMLGVTAGDLQQAEAA